MGEKTSIAWTSSSWNPIRGCSKQPLGGCDNCYAMAMAARFSGPGQAYEGLARKTPRGPEWTGKVAFIEGHLDDPLRWTKPRKVFVNSMSDLFHHDLPDKDIARIFAVMAACHYKGKGHVFQVLTKRPERMAELLGDPGFQDLVAKEAYKYEPVGHAWEWPLPNIWLGTSVENQVASDLRVPPLAATPAAVRFLSVEPMIGSVLLPEGHEATADWIVVGGESGHGARPLDIDWVSDLYAQVKDLDVAWFWKQTGAVLAHRLGLEDRKGEDIEEVKRVLRGFDGSELPWLKREFPEAA